ncbi:hypothetical protein A9P82_07240 [Arachidicoccus ginsenosidimutans]|uniref:universal stress protein n=1 Tax=Arachidicoccus sp. BS20 TaxID=1850526 RepID=UPI0007F0EE99|nr:universal stress protein [Arachidicoccus sp. BS20]ANI89101.1 hypothetical protein A9P82_07240 [Arachidicoccus sp. BS20]
MKTIIASTDFSNEANKAVEYAANVALQLKAKLIIFHNITVEPVWSEYPLSQEVYDMEIDTSKELLSALELEITKNTSGKIPVDTCFKVGIVNSELELLCEKVKPFAVFIAAHMTGSLERFVFGSHAIAIAKYNPFPVVIIPVNPVTFNGFRKVALAIDLENPGDISWEHLRSWLKSFSPKLDVVYISNEKKSGADSLAGSVTAEQQLGCFQPEFHFINNDKVESGIEEYVTNNHPDLLIIHPKKHGWFHKSESNSFILHPPVPVMTLSSVYED